MKLLIIIVILGAYFSYMTHLANVAITAEKQLTSQYSRITADPNTYLAAH